MKARNQIKNFLYLPGLIALAGIIIGLAWAEQLTLTTYYPAPYGVYKTMKTGIMYVKPTYQSEHAAINKEDAMLICAQDDNTFKRWDSAVSDWVPLCGAGGGGGEDVGGIGTNLTQHKEMGGMPISPPSPLFPGYQIGTAYGTRMLIFFSASFARTAAGGWARLTIILNGAAKTRLYIKPDSSQPTPVTFHHLETGISPGTMCSVDVQWQGSGIVQTGSNRVLTALNF